MSNDKLITSFKALASADVGVKKTDLFRIPPLLIQEEEGFNARDYSDPEVIAQIESFASAYENGAFVPPLIVRMDPTTGIVYAVEGHLRRRGALLALERGVELTHLDVVVFRGNDVDRMALMLTSAQGLPLKPLMIANRYLKMTRLGLDAPEIAKRVSRSQNYVEGMLLLATANSDVHKLVTEGSVKATTAIEAVRKYGEGAGKILAEKLDEVQKTGKTTVPASAIKPWMPPRAAVERIYGSLQPMLKSFKSDSLTMIDLLDENRADQLEGKVVTVGATELANLLKAYSHAESIKEKRKERDYNKAAQNSQRDIEDN